MRVHKKAIHNTSSEYELNPFTGKVLHHTPGVEIEVSWLAGYAGDTLADFDSVVASIRAQIVDGKEPTE